MDWVLFNHPQLSLGHFALASCLLFLAFYSQYGDICRNPEGVYAYNSNTVKSYRAPFVTAKPVNGRDKKQSRSGSSRSENVR